MKTTVDLPASLLREAQQTAKREGTTLKSLIEAGLREALARHVRPVGFTLREASVSGRGLQQEFRGAGWDAVRDAAYGRSE